MKKTIISYALALAGSAWLLQYVQYTYNVRVLPTEAYVLIIALLFTALGIWAGRRLSGGAVTETFRRNQKALDYLGISNRELQVLELLGKGHSNQEIADRIFVSTNTVKTHLTHLYEKLEVNRRTQAVKKAHDLQLIP